MSENGENPRPPRDNLYRALSEEVELREEGESPKLVGHFAKFNEWTEINSRVEGRFLERIAPGAFTKTLQEQRDRIRVLFQHGRDPQIGDKPLGTIAEIGEDEQGARYEVDLLDAPYVRDYVLPGLQAGVYGSSFRFRAVKEELERDAEESEHNPNGLPERTITEADVREFGPVTFPAYHGATAGVRSLTDEFIFESLVSDRDKLEELLKFLPREKREEEEPAEDHSSPAPEPRAALQHSGRRSRKQTLYGLRGRKEKPSWRI